MNRFRTSSETAWAAGSGALPLLIVLSAPSGGGKTTICRELERRLGARVVYSVSCTTRPPRPGEAHGREYWFLDAAEFGARVERGEFLEHATVHGARYGTLRAPLAAALAAGQDVLLDIDVQGAAQIRAAAPLAIGACRLPLAAALCSIFVLPPSLDELERRLRLRATESEDAIQGRLARARQEIERWIEYDHVLINDRIEDAAAAALAIREAERHRAARAHIWREAVRAAAADGRKVG